MARKKLPKEDFFVSLSDPTSVRVAMLESTREVLRSIRIFKEIKDIRIEKIEFNKLLRKQLKLIVKTISKIKSTIPSVALPEEIPQKKAKTVATLVEKPRAPIDKLESDLADIEAKLARLS